MKDRMYCYFICSEFAPSHRDIDCMAFKYLITDVKPRTLFLGQHFYSQEKKNLELAGQ